jgi:hypothetical protein
VALGFWDTPGAFSEVGEFCAGWVAPRSLTSKIMTRWPPSSSPEEAKILLEKGRFCSNFFRGWFNPIFAGVLATNGWQNVVS